MRERPELEAVRTLAIAIGVRESARKLGLNQNTVMAWARRYKWFHPASSPPHKNLVHALHARPSEILQEKLQRHSDKTKLGLSKAALKAATKFSRMESDELVRPQTAIAASKWCGTAESVHAWREKSATSSGSVPGLSIYSDKTIVL